MSHLKQLSLLSVTAFFVAFLIGALMFSDPSQAENKSIHGFWLTKNERSVIHIENCKDHKDKICGYVAWIIDGGMQYDSKNPDDSLRTRPICRLNILSGFKSEKGSDTKWVDGKIYKADDGDIYKANLKLLDDGRLRVHGYVGIPLFGKTQIWKRVSKENYPHCTPPKD